jgi:hypothetical protein
MTMTKLLEQAIARARELPPEEQDVIAAVLLSMAEAGTSRIAELDDETRAAIREGLDQARRGEFVPTRKSKRSGNATNDESSLHAKTYSACHRPACPGDPVTSGPAIAR